MEMVLLHCRVFILFPLLFILGIISFILLANREKPKNQTPTKKAIRSVVVGVTVVLAYLMFLHGNYRSTAVDLKDCAQSFDRIISMEKETIEAGYQHKEIDAEGMHMRIHVVTGELPAKEMYILYGNSSISEACIIAKSVFLKGFERRKTVEDVRYHASGMSTDKEQEGVNLFLGGYDGVILMQRDDVNIIIDYWIDEETRPIFCLTTVRPHTVQISKFI